MKKLLLAAGLSAAIAAVPSAWAGGIQIDPTGSGNLGSSRFLTGLGSTTGDFLAAGLATAGNTGTMFGHNAIDLSTSIGGELTFVFGLSTTSSANALNPAAVDYSDTLGRFASGASYFEMYWDPNPSDTNHGAGTGYDNNIFLAAGLVSINPAQGGSIQQTTLGAVGDLSPGYGNAASNIDTARLSGQLTLDIEFIDSTINGAYVVNDLTVASIDLFISENLAAPYINAAASDRVGGSGAANAATGWVAGKGASIIGAVGPDGINNLACGGIVTKCSVQAQMNSTLTFSGARVPEPATLGLMGAGLALFGGKLRSRRKKA